MGSADHSEESDRIKLELELVLADTILSHDDLGPVVESPIACKRDDEHHNTDGMKDDTGLGISVKEDAEASNKERDGDIISAPVGLSADDKPQQHGKHNAAGFNEGLGWIIQKHHGRIGHTQIQCSDETEADIRSKRHRRGANGPALALEAD